MSQYQTQAVLESVDQLTDDIFRISLRAPAIAQSARPGQFVMVKTREGLDPLLRRPFSIHDAPDQNRISLLYKVIGKGTRFLSQFSPGETISIIGPLGNSFFYDKDTRPLIIGGGMGIAPLLFLTRKLLTKMNQEDIQILLGAKRKEEIEPLTQELAVLGVTASCATDDGSFGHHGFVTELFPQPCTATTVFVCGPNALMAAIAKKCQTLDISCHASLEAHMACGLGACLGCTIIASDYSYKHVCKHGPVFDTREILWTL
jgi:dihydroorotate dehydrogenase electron transfer subunit